MSNASVIFANRTGRNRVLLVMNGDVPYHGRRAAVEEFSLALYLSARYAYKFVSRKERLLRFSSARET
jgi:hypothetical protein